MEFLFDQRVIHWHSFFFKVSIKKQNSMVPMIHKVRVDISFDRNHSSKLFLLKDNIWNIVMEDYFYITRDRLNIKDQWGAPVHPYQDNGMHSYSNMPEINNLLCIKIQEYYQKMIKILED
jgi:hypothetical protein